MAEPAHYPRGPSGAHQWLVCTDAPEAQEGYPDETSDAADEGTAAHWLLEQCLNEGVSAEVGAKAAEGVVYRGEVSGCEKDWPITGEMIESVQAHIDAVEKHAKKRGTRLFVEERVMVGEQYGLAQPVGGTADTIMWLPKSKTLMVYDFKYGKGHVVEVDSKGGMIYEQDATGQWVEVKQPDRNINPQIGLYAIAALSQLERLLGKKVEVKWVELGIIQPRVYHKKGAVRTKKISPMQLMDLEFELIQAVNGPRVRRAGDHCFFCRAKHDCEAYGAYRGHKAVSGFDAEEPPAVEATTEPGTEVVPATVPEVPQLQSVETLITRPVKGLTLNELGKARAVLPHIKAWAKEIEEEVRTRLLHDLKVPNARLGQGPGSRAYGGEPWQRDLAAAETAETLGVAPSELYEPPQLKSPAMLEKQLGKATFKDTSLARLVTYTAGGPVVVDEDSDKPDYVKDGGFEAETPAAAVGEKPVESSLL